MRATTNAQSTEQQTTIVQPPQAGRPGGPPMPSQQPTTAMPGVRSQQYPQGPPPQRPPVRPAEVEQHTAMMAPGRPAQRPTTQDKTNYVRTLAPLVGMSVVVVVVIAAIMAWISSFQEPTPTLTANRPALTAPTTAGSATPSAAPTTTAKPKASITRTVPKAATPTTRAVPKTTAPAATSAPAAGAGPTGSAEPSGTAPTSAAGNGNGDNGSTPCGGFLQPKCG